MTDKTDYLRARLGFPLPPAPMQGSAPLTPGRALGIGAIVGAVISWLLLPIIFGPIALILGVISVVQGYKTGWWAVIIAGGSTVYAAYLLMELSNALKSI
jgi:hypothetical protein